MHDISRLMNYLIKTSNASVLPVVRRDETTGKTLALKVKIGVTLYQIINVVGYGVILAREFEFIACREVQFSMITFNV